jgi:hypothetical protein
MYSLRACNYSLPHALYAATHAQLHCSPTRLSKKLKIGKKYFQHAAPREATAAAVTAHQERQRRLSELEEMFLMAEGQTNRGAVNTAVLSERLQVGAVHTTTGSV